VNCSGIRNSVKVSRKKLECLRLALAAHPELRRSGRGGPSRLSEVLEELAIGHFFEKDWARCALAVANCLAHDPTRAGRLAQLAGRRLSRRRGDAGPADLADTKASRG